MATIFRTDLTEEPLDLPKNPMERLKVVQEAVGGDIEAVYVRRNDQVMYINEEGKLRGLPLNRTATVIASKSIPDGDYIVGDVVVLTPEETEADTVD